MKRALAAALTAALLMTLLAGMASARVEAGPDRVSVQPSDTVSDQVHDLNIRHFLYKCWRVLHSDDADPVTKRRCAEIIKRWCQSHPDSRICRQPPPPPDCRPIDRVTDVRSRVIADRVTDVRCHPIDPPRPCLSADNLRRCAPVDPPKDRPIDRPTDRPTDKPVVRPVDTPTRPTKDGIRDGATDRPKDRANDAYVGADGADL